MKVWVGLGWREDPKDPAPTVGSFLGQGGEGGAHLVSGWFFEIFRACEGISKRPPQTNRLAG